MTSDICGAELSRRYATPKQHGGIVENGGHHTTGVETPVYRRMSLRDGETRRRISIWSRRSMFVWSRSDRMTVAGRFNARCVNARCVNVNARFVDAPQHTASRSDAPNHNPKP